MAVLKTFPRFKIHLQFLKSVFCSIATQTPAPPGYNVVAIPNKPNGITEAICVI
jgi:hypothetical protein